MKEPAKAEKKKSELSPGCMKWALAAIIAFMPPLWIMLGLGQVPHFEWSYWHVFFLWNAVDTGIGYLVWGVAHAVRSGWRHGAAD